MFFLFSLSYSVKILFEISDSLHNLIQRLHTAGQYCFVDLELVVVEGMAFLTALVAAWTIVHIIERALRIVSRIPVLSGVNRTLGVFAGGIYGLILVWIGFYIIAVTSTSEMGGILVTYIYQSNLLKYLYENNPILTLIMKFL